jgi:hypothetical protein
LGGFHNPYWMLKLKAPDSQPLFYRSPQWIQDPIGGWIDGVFGNLMALERNFAVLYPLLGLMLLGLVSSRKRTVLLALIWLLLPLPFVLVTGLRIYQRYFSYFLPLCAMVIGHGVAYLGGVLSRKPRMQGILLPALALLAALPNITQLPAYYASTQKDQWREMTVVVDELCRPGDLLVVNAFELLEPLPFEWYTTTPEDHLPRTFFPEDGILSDLGQVAELPLQTHGHKRVWLTIVDTLPEIETLLVRTMDTTHHRVDEWVFQGIRLLLYEVVPLG